MNEQEENGMGPLLLEILRSEPQIVAWLEPDDDGDPDEQPS